MHIRALQLQHILAWKAAQAFAASATVKHDYTTVKWSSKNALHASSLIKTLSAGFAYLLAQLFRSCFPSLRCFAQVLMRHIGSTAPCSFDKADKALRSVQHVLLQPVIVQLHCMIQEKDSQSERTLNTQYEVMEHY